MRRQRRRARNTGPRVSKIAGQVPDSSEIQEEAEEKTIKKAVKKVIDEEDPVRAELVSRLNDAVERWKEEKDIPREKKESKISRVFKKLSRKEKKEREEFEEAQNFLKKIRNFNPKEVENVNLDDIKPKKIHEKRIHHPKSIGGEKLEVEVKDKPKEEAKKEKPRIKQEIDLSAEKLKDKHKEKKAKHRKEIEDAIKACHKPKKDTYRKKTLHIEVSEEKVPEKEIEKIKEIKETPTIKTGKDYKVKLNQFKKAFEKKAADISKGVAKGVRDTYSTLKEKITERREKIQAKAQRQKELREAKAKAYLKKKQKRKEIDDDIEKIYKEIEKL